MLDDRLLIDLIKNNPILYDSGHRDYMDLGMKVVIWKEIGARMNTDVERCKQRWNNIRDNYKKSLKKLTQNKGAKPYRFAWQLSFLKKFMDERDLRNVQLNMPGADYKNSEDDESQSQPEVIDDEETTHDDRKNVTAPGCDVFVSVPVPTDRPRIVKKRKVVRESASSVLMKYLLEKKSADGTGSQNGAMVSIEHPVDSFLFSLSSNLKSLPPNLLMLAKSEIFACVQKYERKRHSTGGDGSEAVKDLDFEELQDGVGKGPLTGENKEQRRLGSHTAAEPPLKKQMRSESIENPKDLMKLACDLLSSSCRQPEETNDEYEGLSKLWTLKLKSLEPSQKRLAERGINEVLFEADSGTLHRNSLQINHLCEPTSVTTSRCDLTNNASKSLS